MKQIEAETQQELNAILPPILDKAFRGELVPTEAELTCREARSCEPASVLLARIKSGREEKRKPENVRRSRTLPKKQLD